MRRALKAAALGLALLVAVAAGVVAYLALGSLPRLAGEVALPGLTGQVEVVRDRWGVPHVRAGSAEDAYAAMGFLHAQDRLWQMEVNRRVGQGRLAEVVGSAALPWTGSRGRWAWRGRPRRR
jgi:penicillin amidase